MSSWARGLSRMAVASVLALAPLVSPTGALARRRARRTLARTDWLLFEIPLDDFVERLGRKDGDDRLIWRGDGCSFADTGTFVLADPCRRHRLRLPQLHRAGAISPGGPQADRRAVPGRPGRGLRRLHRLAGGQGGGLPSSGRGPLRPGALGGARPARRGRLPDRPDDPAPRQRRRARRRRPPRERRPGDWVWVDRSWDSGRAGASSARPGSSLSPGARSPRRSGPTTSACAPAAWSSERPGRLYEVGRTSEQ